MQTLLKLLGFVMLIAFFTSSSKAETHTLGLVGGTYDHGKAIASAELNYTFEKDGIFYNASAFELERGKTSFNVGVGYREEISKGFYLGGMGAFLFTRIERQAENIDNFSMTHFLPLGHSVGFLPWLTLEKQIPINDEWAFTTQAYVNHLAAHISIGVTFKPFTMGE